MKRHQLTGAQLRALRTVADAPLGLVRLSASYHGTPDGEGRVLARVVQGLVRAGLVEWREVAGGWRLFVTAAGAHQLEDVERATSVLAVQGDLFGDLSGDGGAA